MARATATPVPVMVKSDKGTGAAKGSTGARSATGAKGAAGTRKLGGPWGASFTGENVDRSTVKGLSWERRFTTPGIHPYDELEWEYRTAAISS
ncbi:MAG: hypothetical protein QOI92_2374, partial [Chloroflexota bacterium]|nr:hypothetical protein [Chloroflexota bacterium]